MFKREEGGLRGSEVRRFRTGGEGGFGCGFGFRFSLEEVVKGS